MKVLLVDDSQVIRQRLSLMISELEEIEIVGEANCGTQALSMIPETKPDVLILDLSMPHGDGFMVLEKVKKLLPRLSVIVLTQFPHQQHRTRCALAGADYFFDKSTESEMVLEALARESSLKKRGIYEKEI